jgi:DNA mismatch repair protein MutS
VSSPADTPLMRQYLDVKRRHADALLFFRLGDFYELFFDDAVTASRALDLTLTTRDRGREDAVPMCGVPAHAAGGYIARLVAAGHRVAVCDQMEDPRKARGIVKREVTRVVTPGVVLDPEQLDADQPNFLLALAPEGERTGLAWLDLSTAEFRATEVAGHGAAQDEVARIAPREVLLPGGATFAPPDGVFAAERAECFADAAADAALLRETLGQAPGDLGFGEMPLAARAAAAVVRYARATQPLAGFPACRLVAYRPSEHLILDESTVRNLELVETLVEGARRGSLLGVLDRTVTAMGARLLRRWLLYPLAEVAAIRRRQDAVEHLVADANLRGGLRDGLAGVRDLERLSSRAALGLATPREVVELGRSLARIPGLVEPLRKSGIAPPEPLVPPDDDLADLRADVSATLCDEPAVTAQDGAIVRNGVDADLDEARQLAEGGRSAILAIEQRERERTGIPSLKVRYNKVFGYYLEVTRAHLKSVPPDYVRKQTVAGAERYVTPELSDHESRVLGAEERRVAIEQEIFEALRRRVASAAPRVQAAAAFLALVDGLQALAEVAHGHAYVRPVVDDGGRFEIEDGRHPVVEQIAARGAFVPNDVRLDPDAEQLIVLTGPNMAGKSTVMRQVALTAILGHMGAFVPARRAHIGVLDRIFTRVGAVDNVARGESTFMVEMRESAHILRAATRRSLVVLDEIGRGTATYDGISIAWAVAEYLHDRVRCKTMFATHYHELCALAETKPRVRNFNVAVSEQRGDIVFLHRLVPGGASRSYGIQVARLAGLPPTVIGRAKEILATIEAGGAAGAPPSHAAPAASPQLDLFAPKVPSAVVEALRAADPDRMTPLEALSLLADLRQKVGDG